ncbi:MAG: hypothetical protein CMJ30_07555 [Phycisphaerae bacterium]|nr:hypothetical protein [Phycisphaerae bacterium]
MKRLFLVAVERKEPWLRILMINQVFYPDVAATAQHAHDLSRSLVASGHEVSIIASRALYGQKGAALPAYEAIDGVHVHRVGRSFFGKASIVARIFDFGYFYLAAAVKAIMLRRHDVSICFTTPPFIALLGWFLRLFKGTKMVYWVMDLYPDLPVACGVMREGAWSTKFFEGINRFCLRRANAVVALGRCMRDRILAKGIAERQVQIIGVWTDSEEVKPIPRESNRYRNEWQVEDRFLVMYSGNFGLGHDVDTFLQATKRLQNDDRIRFAFVGGGKKKSIVENFVNEHGLTNAVLAPYQPRESLDELLSAADCHLVSLLVGVEGIMVPCKLFGILASARPALFIGSHQSEIAQVIQDDACGSTVDEGDVDALVQAILAYADDPELAQRQGEAGRVALVQKHATIHRCAAWENLLQSVVDQTKTEEMGA